MSDGARAVYSDLPANVQKHLLELETFIGDCDGQWTALQTSDQNVVIDNGTIDASDAVTAFNGIVAALRASPPAAPAGGERETALRDQVFKTIEVLQSPDVTMDSEFRSFTAKQLQKALDYAAPAQSIEDEGEREAAIERIMSIRNGMTPDMEARAIVRRELAALGATAQSNGDEGELIKLLDEARYFLNFRQEGPDCDHADLIDEATDEIKSLRDQLAKARAALEHWSHQSRLQTFEDRQRFREEAAEVLKESA